MNSIEHMQHFTRGLKTQDIILLDASTGGSIKNKNEDKVKELIKKMCQNDYHSQSERWVKPKGVLELDSNTIVLSQLQMISK